MQIKTSVKINVEKKGNRLIVYELGTLNMVMGSAGIGGNIHLYNIKKGKGYWEVPIATIKERIKYIEGRIVKQEKYLQIMRQVIR